MSNNFPDGIEVFVGSASGQDIEYFSCARCGSSVKFVPCWNCDDGWVEKNIGDDVVEELEDFPCEYCGATGGHWHCISSPDWCRDHPLPGREHVESTAMKPEAWRDVY